MKLYCPKANTDGEGLGVGGVDCRILESDLRLHVEIKIVLWHRLSSLCAPLYYNKNSHVLSYCCDPVVDEKRYYHAVKII